MKQKLRLLLTPFKVLFVTEACLVDVIAPFCVSTGPYTTADEPLVAANPSYHRALTYNGHCRITSLWYFVCCKSYN